MTFNEKNINRDTAGRFDEKPQSAAEASLPARGDALVRDLIDRYQAALLQKAIDADDADFEDAILPLADELLDVLVALPADLEAQALIDRYNENARFCVDCTDAGRVEWEPRDYEYWEDAQCDNAYDAYTYLRERHPADSDRVHDIAMSLAEGFREDDALDVLTEAAASGAACGERLSGIVSPELSRLIGPGDLFTPDGGFSASGRDVIVSAAGVLTPLRCGDDGTVTVTSSGATVGVADRDVEDEERHERARRIARDVERELLDGSLTAGEALRVAVFTGWGDRSRRLTVAEVAHLRAELPAGLGDDVTFYTNKQDVDGPVIAVNTDGASLLIRHRP